MKPTIFAAMIALALSAAPTPASADMFQPSYLCRKPVKPLELESQFDVDMFVDDVERYKRCIADFVEEQNEQAAKHQAAAEEAIDEWNRFVRYELN